MKKFLSYIIFLLLLYLWIFSPSFGFFREKLAISYVIDYVCIFACIVHPQIFFNFYRKYQKEFVWLLYFMVFSIFLAALDHQTIIIIQHLIVIVNLFCVTPMFLTYARRYGFNSESDITKSLLIVCSIAAVISVLCFSVPQINDYVKYTLIKYDTETLLYDLHHRGFGFASNLLGNYGFLLGFLLALGCANLKENHWFILFIPFIIIAIMINARTGILIAFMGIACNVLQRKSTIGYGIVIVSFVFFFLHLDSFLLLLGSDDTTIEWIAEFKESIENVITDKDVKASGTTDILFGDMVVFPENLEQWLIGRGYYLFRNEHAITSSDMGWINQLNYGGVFYFIPLMLFFLEIVKNFVKNKGMGFGLFILTTIVISNTKGILFPTYPLFFIILFIHFSSSQKQNGSDHIVSKSQANKYTLSENN